MSPKAAQPAASSSSDMIDVHVVVPEGIDDPGRPSGGNVYDRRVCDGLRLLGWSVTEHAIAGPWPLADVRGQTKVGNVLAGLPDGAMVLLDGLIASGCPRVLVPESDRLTLVVLVHMPLGDAVATAVATSVATAAERAVLSAARAIVTTSEWTRGRLLELYPLRSERIHVARPGVEVAGLAPGTAAGGELLCVAAVTPGKGHDVLLAGLAALKGLADLHWRCVCVGALDRDPVFAEGVRRMVATRGLSDRVCFAGPRTGLALTQTYADADVVVLASRAETYGMVVTEALAAGLPVITSDVGGVPEALGLAADGSRPGILVPADDPGALTSALTGWLTDPLLRDRLREAARARRADLADWSTTAAHVAYALAAA